jgi:regulator of PEP synthase PpsR (kinase-PPPase family)
MENSLLPVIFVVSDGRGETCTQWLRAALVQFEDEDFDLVTWSEVRTPGQVREITEQAARRSATIFYTLVSPQTREVMVQRCEELLVPAVDVLGPAFGALHDLFQKIPLARPGLFYASDRERFDRQAAIDFTLKHDDGQRPHELGLADIVIVGVSRSSKSTTCFYLAYQGIKAANVPLVPGTPVLPQLSNLDPEKVIGLRMNVSRLITVRQARTTHLGIPHTEYYVDKRALAMEVAQANQIMSSHGWASFDASYMAVEEIARRAMRLRGWKLVED